MATDGGAAGAGALRLLGANRPFRLLWTARAVSFLGDSLSLVALMLHVAGTTGQALAVAALLLAGDFAPALLGPLTGTVADRLDRRRVMIACELVQGALVVVIALWLPSLPLLLVLVGLRAVAGQVFMPASRAAIPAVVPEPALGRANAAVGVATNGGEALGPLVAAVALPVLEVRGVLLVDAASFLVSAVLLGFLPPLAGTGGERARPRSFLADAGAGLRYLRGQPVLRAVVAGYVAVVACTGIDDVALVGLRAVAGQVFQPASRAAVPAVVPERDLERANAAVGVATNGGETLGPLVAALLLPVLDVRGVLLVDAATFGVSAVVLGFLPALPGAAPEDGRRPPFLADARAGLRYLGGQATVRAVILGYFAIVACNGIDDVALVFLATDTLGAGDAAVALLLAAVGIGLLAGYALLARTRARVPMPALLLAGFAVSSAGNLLTGLAWAVAAAFAVQAVRGLGIAALDVAAATLLQRTVPPHLLGRVFGILHGGIGVAAALAYLLGGLLLDRTTPRVAFVAAGAAGLLATAVTALALRRAANSTERPT